MCVIRAPISWTDEEIKENIVPIGASESISSSRLQMRCTQVYSVFLH